MGFVVAVVYTSTMAYMPVMGKIKS